MMNLSIIGAATFVGLGLTAGWAGGQSASVEPGAPPDTRVIGFAAPVDRPQANGTRVVGFIALSGPVRPLDPDARPVRILSTHLRILKDGRERGDSSGCRAVELTAHDEGGQRPSLGVVGGSDPFHHRLRIRVRGDLTWVDVRSADDIEIIVEDLPPLRTPGP